VPPTLRHRIRIPDSMIAMPRDSRSLRDDIIAAARAFSRLNYVHAFGHVSARLEATFLLTPTRPPLGTQCAADLLEVDLMGRVLSGDPAARPIEAFLHIGIYVARPDVQAICRTHAPYASAWPAGDTVPAIQHGFGGIVDSVAAYKGCDLIHNGELGTRAAESLGVADALMLRGNGVVTVGKSLGEAAARMWSLEERFAHARRQGVHLAPFTPEDLEARRRWYPAEAERVWIWLKSIGTSNSAHGGA
jgi:HCOMODA/2-hydroxy-3-carboxy-muconic semialdehyde decarboxylase